MRRFVSLLLLLFACALPSSANAQPAATITILHFNDIYEIMPVEGGRSGGAARVAALRAELKRADPGLITTLGGDYLSPSALGTARVNGQPLAGQQMVAVLNVLGLDWATFGNHEFDVSEASFRARLAEGKFRIVSSNVTDANGQPFPGTVTQAIVPVRRGARTLRVGLIGLTIEDSALTWARIAPPLDAARRAVQALQGQCDAIVALTHLPLAADQRLVEQVPEIDLVLGGHEHENWMLRRGATFTPIVKADANVRTVAIVTLRFGKNGDRPAVNERLVAITDRMKDGPRTAAEVAKWTALGFHAFREQGFEPTQVVVTSDVPLDGRESAVRNGSTRLTTIIGEAVRHEGANTDAAIYNSGSVRIDDVLPLGPVTQYDVIRVLPFGGRVLRVTMAGALLSKTLDVGLQNRGTGGFLQWDGITHEADGFRIGGQPIDPARQYVIAITDFLMTGREANLPFLTRNNPDVSHITELRDVRLALIDELRRQFPASGR